MSNTGKKVFGFQAKVLFPVVTILIVLLATIIWLVNRRLVDEYEEEARQNLSISDAVFRNSFDIRTRNLLLRYELLVNEPRFRAVAQLAEPKTMTVQLRELLDETAPDASVMIFTMDKNRLLAGVSRDHNFNLEDFSMQSADLINEARQGRAGTASIAVDNRLFNAIAVPVIAENNLAGVLSIGVDIGANAAQELKSLTRSEVVFIANNTVVASTISKSELYPQLFFIYKKVMASGGSIENARPVAKEVVIANGEHFLCLARDFKRGEGSAGYLLLSSYEASLAKSADTQRTLLALGAVGILFSSLLIWALVRKVTTPLRQLRKSTEAVGAGDFSQRVPVQSSDEFGELATVFNRTMENLTISRETLKKTQAQLLQSEKLSAIGEFVAGVAHELNNPLTGVIGFSEMLQESCISEQQQAYLVRIVDCAERCHKIVQSLLSFSRKRVPEMQMVSPNELIRTTIEAARYDLDGSDIEIVTELSPSIPSFPLDPYQMEQVFLNIIHNARHAIRKKGGAGKINISTALMDGHARIRFEDNGCGIAQGDLDKIFNPFFTTKRVGEGTGLGLSLSYGIVREHGGTITAESKPGEGAIFTVDLPITEMQIPCAPPGQIQSTTQIGSNNGIADILVVDDEEAILELIRGALSARGHQVEVANSGEEALGRIADHSYDVIICDWKFPGMDGEEIYKQAGKINTMNLQRFLFITGNLLSRETEGFFTTEGRPYLLKPFSVDQLRKSVEQVLKEHH